MTIITDHTSHPRQEGRPYGAIWILTVPWAHPFWSQYWVSLVDITTPLKNPPMMARAGMTHEVMVWAIDPGTKIEKLVDHPQGGKLLGPPNQAYQFPAADDVAAEQRIAGYIAEIEAKRLSPDTDYRSVWDALFKDGASLIYNQFERMGATLQ